MLLSLKISVMKASSPSSLEYLYLGDDSSYALSGNTRSLLEAGRSLGIPQPTTLRYLQGEPTYTLHRPRRVRFPRSKTVVDPNVDSTWQADLVEMQDRQLIAANKRTRYLLTIIDVLSKYAWVVGLKSKRGTAVRDALQYVLETTQIVVLPTYKPIRVKNVLINMSNNCWTIMRFSIIPPEGNPKQRWSNDLIGL